MYLYVLTYIMYVLTDIMECERDINTSEKYPNALKYSDTAKLIDIYLTALHQKSIKFC